MGTYIFMTKEMHFIIFYSFGAWFGNIMEQSSPARLQACGRTLNDAQNMGIDIFGRDTRARTLAHATQF